MKTMNEFSAAATKILNFASPSSESIGSNIRDNVLTAVGAKFNLSVVIARETVTLYGYEDEAYALRAIEQVTEAGGLNCVALVV